MKLCKVKSLAIKDGLLEIWGGQFENAADQTDNAKTFVFVELIHADFKIYLKIEKD